MRGALARLSLSALTTRFITVCGETYQRAARDGFHQRVEDVDGEPQQRGPAVDDGFIHVVLKERQREADKTR